MSTSALPTPLRFEVELDAYAGPFDLLLALVLRDGIELVDVQVLGICVRYLELLDAEDALDLDAASEFLVLVAALCELKARRLLPREEADELPEPELAAEELAARLAEYARARAAAEWLRGRLLATGRRVWRDGPPAVRLAPPEAPAASGDPALLRAAIERLLAPPEPVQVTHLPRRNLPFRRFLDHLRTMLAEHGTMTFDDAVRELDRMEQAMAFWAALELYKRGEIRLVQAEPFAPIRPARASGIVHRPAPGTAVPAPTHAEVDAAEAIAG